VVAGTEEFEIIRAIIPLHTVDMMDVEPTTGENIIRVRAFGDRNELVDVDVPLSLLARAPRPKPLVSVCT
jgi:hypothetical protein